MAAIAFSVDTKDFAAAIIASKPMAGIPEGAGPSRYAAVLLAALLSHFADDGRRRLTVTVFDVDAPVVALNLVGDSDSTAASVTDSARARAVRQRMAEIAAMDEDQIPADIFAFDGKAVYFIPAAGWSDSAACDDAARFVSELWKAQSRTGRAQI